MIQTVTNRTPNRHFRNLLRNENTWYDVDDVGHNFDENLESSNVYVRKRNQQREDANSASKTQTSAKEWCFQEKN